MVGSGAGGLTAGQIDHLQLTTRLRVPESGRYSVGHAGLSEFRLVIDGEVVVDEAIELPGADVVEGIMKPLQHARSWIMDAGQDVLVELSYRPTGGATVLGGADVTMLTVQLNVAPVLDEQRSSIARLPWRAIPMSSLSWSAPTRR